MIANFFVSTSMRWVRGGGRGGSRPIRSACVCGLAGEGFQRLRCDARPKLINDDGPVVEWIVDDIRQALILKRRGPAELCRASHVECLVGTFVVVATDELIELGQLLEEVAGRRSLEARLEKVG
jgi:hypothetical protein